MELSLVSQRLYSFIHELYLGVRTTGYVAPTVKWGVHYTPLPYQVVDRILDRLVLGAEDVFVDIGCGKGRVVCCACRRPLKRVIGIEVNKSLLDLAAQNVFRLRGKQAKVELLGIPAEQYDYSDASAIYLYNPFDRPIMNLVFSRLNDSFCRNPRKIRVAYANCVHEESLAQLGWLKKREEWPANKFPAFGCPISFWHSV